jgi:hypothetical protein
VIVLDVVAEKIAVAALGAEVNCAIFAVASGVELVGETVGQDVLNLWTNFKTCSAHITVTQLLTGAAIGYGLGVAAEALGGLLPAAAEGAEPWLAPDNTPQYVKNFANGRAFEQQGLNYLEGVQNDIAPQVSVRPYLDNGDLANYRVRLDAIGTDDAGNLKLTDFKSSETAGFTTNQTRGYPLLGRNGGVVVGNSGGDFYPPGTQIPPTPVGIITPADIP